MTSQQRKFKAANTRCRRKAKVKGFPKGAKMRAYANCMSDELKGKKKRKRKRGC